MKKLSLLLSAAALIVAVGAPKANAADKHFGLGEFSNKKLNIENENKEKKSYKLNEGEAKASVKLEKLLDKLFDIDGHENAVTDLIHTVVTGNKLNGMFVDTKSNNFDFNPNNKKLEEQSNKLYNLLVNRVNSLKDAYQDDKDFAESIDEAFESAEKEVGEHLKGTALKEAKEELKEKYDNEVKSVNKDKTLDKDDKKIKLNKLKNSYNNKLLDLTDGKEDDISAI